MKLSELTDRRPADRWWVSRMLVLFAVLALVVAACAGGDADTSTDETGDTAAEETDDTMAEETDDTAGETDASGEPVEGGTLRYAYQGDPRSLDTMTSDGNPFTPRDAIFERLYGFGKDTFPVPYLASHHEVSDDGLTWTIHLREGILFHNGEELTADDVMASWERYQAVGVRMNEYFMVDEITQAGEYSIAITTNEPHGGVVESLAAHSGSFAIMPRSVVDALGPDFESELPFDSDVLVGTGPYQYVEHEPEQMWVFERFDDYWGGPPDNTPEDGYMATARNAYIDRIEYHVITDPATRVSAVLADEIDVAAPIPADQAEAVRGEPGVNVGESVPGRRAYWKFNTTKPPFDDLKLREAVRAGVDPEEQMAAFGPSQYWRVNCTPRITEEHYAWQDYCEDYYPRDIELARQLVEESDYDGSPVLVLGSESRPEYPIMVPMITYLEEIGINVEPVIVDGATYSEMRGSPTNDWHLKIAGGQPITSTEYLNAMGYDREGNKWPGVEDAYYDNIAAAARTDDREERTELIHLAYESLMDSVVDLWIGDELTVALYRDRVHNLPNDDYEFNWYNAWLDPQ